MLLRALFLSAAIIAGGLAALVATAGAAAPMLPNLLAHKPTQLQTQTVNGRLYLRFTTTTWNSGLGPLEVRGGAIDSTNGTQLVYQRIYYNDTSYTDALAGTFVWHAGHNHIHFEDFAEYAIEPANAPGSTLGISQKTSFCMLDTTRIKNGRTARQPVYTTCGTAVQGISAGWGDTYPYYLDGQALDITGLPDGDYRLVITADPENLLAETNDGDNSASLLIRIASGTVTPLEKVRNR